MSRKIKFEYGFESVNGIIKKVYYLHEIPFIAKKCDVWNINAVVYVRQFTGLQDKNGKDIYEGDIVIYDYTTNKTTNEKWTVKGKAIIYQKKEARFKFDDGSCFGLIYDKYEVIGSIHEN